MITRNVQELTDVERTALFGWGGDIFGIEALNLEWRRKDWHVIVESDGRAVSHVGFIRRRAVTVGREQLFLGGVGGVVTVPGARGRGFASAALREAERQIAEDLRVAFAMLFCLETVSEFYSRRGWLRVSEPVLIRKSGAVCELPLSAMVRCLRQRSWPDGIVTVDGPAW